MRPAARPYRLLIPWILLLGSMISIPVSAHELSGLNGKNPTHQHVYKNSGYGKGLTPGHYAQPAGSNGIVIWSASASKSFGKSQPGFVIPGHYSPKTQKELFHRKPAFKQDQVEDTSADYR